MGRRTRRQNLPVGNETTACQPTTFPSHPREIPGLFQAHPAPEQAARLRLVFCHAAPTPLNRGQALTAIAAAIGQGGLPALAGITIQESVLPFAANLRRLILTFHMLFKFL